MRPPSSEALVQVRHLLIRHCKQLANKCMLNYCLEWDKWVLNEWTYPTPDSGLTHLFTRSRAVVAYTVVHLVTPDSTRWVINPLYHSRHNDRGRQYECDRGINSCQHSAVLCTTHELVSTFRILCAWICYYSNAAKLLKIKCGNRNVLQTWLDIGQISNGICLVASNSLTAGCLVTA